MRGALLAIVLLTPGILTGCVGADTTDDGALAKQRADVTQDRGGIEGVITDTAIQPVGGANVTLIELDRTVRSASDGSFAFSHLAPGTYTIVVQAPGFVSAQATAVVAAGRATPMDLVLAHLTSQDAYTQALEIAGFVECGVGWRTPLPEPAPPRVRQGAFAACATPNGIIVDNATNDRFIHLLELDAPLTTLIYEMYWETGGLGDGAWLWSILDLAPVFNTEGSRIISKQAQSPMYVRVDEAQWDELADNVTAGCQADQAEGEDEGWCSMAPRDEGWPFMLRVFAHADCVPAPASACVLLQQRFDHVLTAFYNGEAPAGYTALGG